MRKSNRELLQYWCDEGFNKNNITIADEVYDTNVVYHEPSAGTVTGIEALKQFVVTWRAGFPDSQLAIEEEIIEPARIALRWTFEGTHKGNFRELTPTGKRVKMEAMYFYRFAKGKVVEIHAMVNMLKLLQQLGAIPSKTL